MTGERLAAAQLAMRERNRFARKTWTPQQDSSYKDKQIQRLRETIKDLRDEVDDLRNSRDIR